MNSPKIQKWMFILIPALAMSLGWGLRGQVGHSTGAMIPGALVALVLCSLLPDKQFSRGMVIGLGAIAFGYGATMTTQDTADLALRWIFNPGSTLPLAFTGLAIKGALWALFGGIFIGLAFAASHYRWRDIVLGMVFMVASFPLGWMLINKPRPVYFSVTRHESYGGYLVAGIVLLAWLTFRGRTKIPLTLGLCAALAGAIGLPLGAVLGGAGSHTAYVGRWYDWWKVLETTFGACMGAGLGIGTYLVKDKLPDLDEWKEPAARALSRAWGTVLGLVICEAFAVLAHLRLGGWLIFGSVLLCVVFYFPKQVGWHVGLTMTIYVTAVNVITYWHREQKIGNPLFLWTLVWLLTLAVSWKVAGWWDEKDRAIRKSFVFLMWTIVVLTTLRGFIIQSVLHPPAQAVATAGGRWIYTVDAWASALVVQIVLAIMAFVLTWLIAKPDTPWNSSGRSISKRAMRPSPIP